MAAQGIDYTAYVDYSYSALTTNLISHYPYTVNILSTYTVDAQDLSVMPRFGIVPIGLPSGEPFGVPDFAGKTNDVEFPGFWNNRITPG